MAGVPAEPPRGAFVYDPSTPNALTPQQVAKKRGRFEHQTQHLYLQQLDQPGFELNLPGHEIVGSGRSLVSIKYREMDTLNSALLFKDGKNAFVESSKRDRHGRLSVDGKKVKDAEVQLHFFDRGGKLEGAQLPRRFPLALGKDLMLTASVRIEGSSDLFQLTEMSARTLPRRGASGAR